MRGDKIKYSALNCAKCIENDEIFLRFEEQFKKAIAYLMISQNYKLWIFDINSK